MSDFLFCTSCRIPLADHQQLCPFCEVEGRGVKSMYCPPCGIRLYQPRCPYCGTEGAYPMLDNHVRDLFLVIVRGFQENGPVPEAAMRLLRLLYTAGIYNKHRESLEACLNTLEETLTVASSGAKTLIIYLIMEYCDNSTEWFNHKI